MPPRTLNHPSRRKPCGWRLSVTAGLLCLGLTCRTYADPTTPVPPVSRAAIAIIIDDLGYHREAGERAVRLPGAITVAVLPHQKYSRQLAHDAVAAGKELILHAPMEPQNQVAWETKGLSSELSLAELHAALEEMLQATPQATGLNNHMGSKFTEHADSMKWLMEELKRHKLFFIDSLTTPGSLAWRSAQSAGVPWARRDVFLDNVAEPAAVEKQLQKLFEIARLRGYALAIGHPHEATLEVLERYLPQLDALGVKLVPASALIQQSKVRQSHFSSSSAAETAIAVGPAEELSLDPGL